MNTEREDRRSLLIVVAILAGVVALGLVWMSFALWQSFGGTTLEPVGGGARASKQRATVWVLVDGLRADVLGDPDGAFPLLDELAAAGAALPSASTASTATAAAVASLFANAPVEEHGLLSPRWIGHHRLPERFETAAERASAASYATSGFVSAAGLRAGWTGLERGFDTWDAPGTERDFRAVLDAAESAFDAPGARLDAFVVLQLALGDAPDPARLVRLLRARLERFDELRAEVTAALDVPGGDEARAKAVESSIGRRRGTVAWGVWREACYDALLGELDARLRRFLERWKRRPDVLLVGTRGRLVTEPRPEPEVEGFSPALVFVPCVAAPLTLLDQVARLNEGPRRVYSATRGRTRDVADLTRDLPAPITVAFRAGGDLRVEVRDANEPRSRVRDVREAVEWNLDDRHATLRVEVTPWSAELATTLAVEGAATEALGDVTWPWIADPSAPAWPDGSAWSVDVARDRTRWTVALAPSVEAPVLVHLAALPWSRDDALLEVAGADVRSGPLPGAAVFVLEPGASASFVLAPGKRPALRAALASDEGAGRALDPARVRFEGRHLFSDAAAFFVPAWWPARADWFVPELAPTESAAPDEFFHRLRVQRADRGPTMLGPLRLAPDDVAALRRLPDDA